MKRGCLLSLALYFGLAAGYYLWFKDRYKEVMRSPDLYADRVARELCREHADLRPVSVILLEVDQQDFRPEDRLDDKSPFDEEFLDVNTLRTVQCPSR